MITASATSTSVPAANEAESDNLPLQHRTKFTEETRWGSSAGFCSCSA